MSIADLFLIYLKVSAVATALLVIAVVNTRKRGTSKDFAKKLQTQKDEKEFVMYSDLLQAN